MRNSLAFCLKVKFVFQRKSCGNLRCNVYRYCGSTGKSRAFDTGNVVEVSDAAFPHHKVVGVEVSTQTGKLCDYVPAGQGRFGDKSSVECRVQFVGSCAYVVLVFHIRSRGSNQNVAVRCGCYQNALAHVGGKLEQRVRSKISASFVHQNVVPFACRDVHFFRTNHIVYFVGVDACAVDYYLCLMHRTVGTFHVKHVALFLDGNNLRKETEFHTVFGGVFRIGYCHFVGRCNASVGDNQCRHGFFRNVRLHCSDFVVAFDNVHIGYAVFDSTVVQFLQFALLTFIKTQHHGSVTTERKFQFFRKFVKHFVSQNVVMRFQSAGHGIVATVHDTAVSLCRSDRHVVASFQHQNVRFVS